MSFPRADPAFTMAELREVGQRFIDAGREYWTAAHKAGMSGAVIWLSDTQGGFVLYTRGEYRHTIMQNIDRIGPETSFGTVRDE